MSKILYIEDELTKHIPTIKKLFKPILISRNILNQLNELETRTPLYNQNVVNVCDKATELDVCFKFSTALSKIAHNHQDYDLIIIDRDLSKYDYSDKWEEIKAALTFIGLASHEGNKDEYFAREGDLLLLTLLRIDPAYKDNVYLLSTESNSNMKNPDELETIIDITGFSADRILIKDTDMEKVISDIVADFPTFSIQNRFREQCNILRKHLSEDDVDQFISMIGYFENSKLNEFVFFLRKLLDNLLHHIAFQMKEPNAEYWNDKNKKQLQIKPFIKGIKKKVNYDYIPVAGLPAYDRKHHIGYNSIIRNACLSIFEITSDSGVHELSKSIDINSLGTSSLTNYTKATLLGQICDVILWYDKVMDSFKK